MKDGVYLSKGGKVSGPFNPEDLRRMRESGEIHNFTWIWSVELKQWSPIDPPPPPPPGNVPHSGHASISIPSFPANKKTSRAKKHEIAVICHDHRHVVSGNLDHVTDLGCTVASDSNQTEPELCTKSYVVLNLLNPQSGRSMNVKGRLMEIRRGSSGWDYQIAWEHAPDLAALG